MEHPYLVHRLVGSITPVGSRVLWRLMQNRLIVRSTQPLDWPSLSARHPQFADRNDSIQETQLRSGDTFLTNVIAYTRGRKENQRWQIRPAEDYLEWLDQQGRKRGFTVLEADVVRQFTYHVKMSTATVNLRPVELMAAVQVTDSAQFNYALASGIGRMRAYGCGLLLIRRGE